MNLEKNEVGEIVQRNPDGTLKAGTRLNPHGAGAPGKRIWDEFQKTVENKLPVFLEAFVNGFSDDKKGHIPTKEHYIESDKALEMFVKFKPKEEDDLSGSVNWTNYREAFQALLAEKHENADLKREVEALKLQLQGGSYTAASPLTAAPSASVAPPPAQSAQIIIKPSNAEPEMTAVPNPTEPASSLLSQHRSHLPPIVSSLTSSVTSPQSRTKPGRQSRVRLERRVRPDRRVPTAADDTNPPIGPSAA